MPCAPGPLRPALHALCFPLFCACSQAASIMVADYPAPVEGWTNEAVEADMAYVLTVINK